MTTKKFYTQTGWAGSNYDGKLTVKEITAKIREFVKKEFPECKFSITRNYNSIYVALMEAPREVVKDGVTIHQHFMGLIPDNDKTLSNYGFALLSRVACFVESYNYDDSDGMIDYFDTNFYFHLEVGRWDKPFKVVESKAKQIAETITPVQADGVKLVDYSEKSFAVIGNTKNIKDQLKELGGRFNFNLSCGAGWIFSIKQENAVKIALGL